MWLRENCHKCNNLVKYRILDKKVSGTLDQSRGCLIIYHEQKKDKLYNKSTDCMSNLLQVVYKLNQASNALKKAHWFTLPFIVHIYKYIHYKVDKSIAFVVNPKLIRCEINVKTC